MRAMHLAAAAVSLGLLTATPAFANDATMRLQSDQETSFEQVATSADMMERLGGLFASDTRSTAGQDLKAARAATEPRLAGEPVKLFHLSRDFVLGQSTNPAEEYAAAVAAEAKDGQKGVVILTKGASGWELFQLASGDDEVRYAAMADGGIVFTEPQIHAWYRLKDGQVTPLEDYARRSIGESASVADYQTMVQARYADKIGKGGYGGISPETASLVKPQPANTLGWAAGAAAGAGILAAGGVLFARRRKVSA